MKSENGVAKYSTAKGVRWKAHYYKTDGREGSKAEFLTEGAAKAFLRELETSRVQGNFIDPARGRVPISAIAEEWLVARRAATLTKSGKRSTLSRVKGIAENHILPSLGDIRVGALTQADGGAWVSTLTGEAHGYGVLTLVLAYCGLRWSEMAGLRIEDVDLVKRRIHVEHTIVLVDGRQVEDVPKSYEKREVPIPGFLVTLLEQHIERREAELRADQKLIRAQLAAVVGREDAIAALRKKQITMTEYIAKVATDRAEVGSYIAQLHRDRDTRIATNRPYDEFDRLLEIAHNKLDRLPRPEVLTARRDGIPAKIARIEKSIAKTPRQKEILEVQLAAIKQKPLFVGQHTRIWLRNAPFRSGWLTPAVKLMDEEAKQAALEAGERAPRPLGDIEPHELRHTCGSLAVSAGANVKVVQRLLGHEKASVTLDTYSSLFETDLDDVARRMDEIVWSMNADTDFASETRLIGVFSPANKARSRARK